eukprot:GSChrysophyteH1.ASY1.ANO1.2043.1 assembled CDS
MADSVQFILDRLAHVFRSMEELGLFGADEIASIVKKRTDFEYVLKRRQLSPGDFYNYLQYEINLEKLRILRSAIVAALKDRQDAIRNLQSSNIKHICSVFERAIRRFPNEIDFVMDYISFLKDELTPAAPAVKKGHEAYLVVSNKTNSGTLNEVLGRALALHPKNEKLWIMAAMHEVEANNNVHAARNLLQRALRANQHSAVLYKQYFELELWHALRLRERRKVLTKHMEEGYLLGAPVVVFKHALQNVNDPQFACELLQLVSTNCHEDNEELGGGADTAEGGVQVSSVSSAIRELIVAHFSQKNTQQDELISLWKALLRASLWSVQEDDDSPGDEGVNGVVQAPDDETTGKKRKTYGEREKSLGNRTTASIRKSSTLTKSFTSVIQEAIDNTSGRLTTGEDFANMMLVEATAFMRRQREYIQALPRVLSSDGSSQTRKMRGKGTPTSSDSNTLWVSLLDEIKAQHSTICDHVAPVNENIISFAANFAHYCFQVNSLKKLCVEASGYRVDIQTTSHIISSFKDVTHMLDGRPAGSSPDKSITDGVDAYVEFFNGGVEFFTECNDNESILELVSYITGMAEHIVVTEKGIQALLVAVDLLESLKDHNSSKTDPGKDIYKSLLNGVSSRSCLKGRRGALASSLVEISVGSVTAEGVSSSQVLKVLRKIHQDVTKQVLKHPVLLVNADMLTYYVTLLEASRREVLRENGGEDSRVGGKKDKSQPFSYSQDKNQLLAFMRSVCDEALRMTHGEQSEVLWDLREEVEVLSKSPKELSAIKWRRSRV